MVYPDWDAVADGSCPFHVYCDASIDSLGVALEQEHPDGSVRPIDHISRATLDSGRSWTPLYLGAGSIVWVIKRLRGYLWGTKFRIFWDHKALEIIVNVGDHDSRVKRWLEFLTASHYILEYRKGGINGNADFLSRFSEPATVLDLSGSSGLTPVDDGDIFLNQTCGHRNRSSPTTAVGLSRLVLHPESAVLSGLPFASSDFRDFRANGPRMRIDDLPAPSGRFVVRVSAAVTTADRRPGRGELSPDADTAFASFLAVPSFIVVVLVEDRRSQRGGE